MVKRSAVNTLLVIAKVLPEPASSAAGSRMLQLLGMFKDRGWQIHLATSAQSGPYSIDPESMGFRLHHIKVNDPATEEFLSRLQPKAVLFDRFMTEEQFGWKVAEQCPEAIRILDTEDLHGLRAAREKALKEDRAFSEKDLLNPVMFREVASIYRCDISLIISTYEMQLLCDRLLVPITLLHYLPFLFDDKSLDSTGSAPAFSERRDFVSIGNFLHAPNLDAVYQLQQSIWPGIRARLPEANLLVYGAYMPETIKAFHSPENGFLVKGRADDVNQVMRGARINLAALRFGAGLKGKLFDALRHATPSICSRIAAEGMPENETSGFVIAGDEAQFIDAAVKLYHDEKSWTKRSQACAGNLRHFLRKDFEAPFFADLEERMRNLVRRREENFTGALLQQQAFYSNKYMGLWIEAKNRNPG